MISDLRLLKYLQGRLSEKDSLEITKQAAESQELRDKLKDLQRQSASVKKPLWQRVLFDAKTQDHRGFRTTVILPILLMVGFIMLLSWMWLTKPQGNPAFILQSNSGTSIELLYHAKDGWRFINEGYQPGDSLSLSIRTPEKYHIHIFAAGDNQGGNDIKPVYETEYEALSKEDHMPVFQLPQSTHPSHLIIAYNNHKIPDPDMQKIKELLTTPEDMTSEQIGFDYLVYRLN